MLSVSPFRRNVLTLILATVVVAFVPCVFWLVHSSRNQTDTATVYGTYIGGAALAVTLLLALGTWWADGRRRDSAVRSDTSRQVSAAADRLAQDTAEKWRLEAARRRIITPAPATVRWRWAAQDVAASKLEVSRPPTAGTGPAPLLDLASPGEVLGSGVVTRLHDEVYAKLPFGRLVLIGGPGAGKTGAMVLLLLAALDRRAGLTPDQRDRVPVPVWLTLGGWDPSATSLDDWVCDSLRRDYPALWAPAYGTDVVRELLRGGRVALFLDGLDEMPAAARPLALKSVNEAARGLRVVVTSRPGEYQDALQAGGLDNSAVIELRPVRPDAAAAYLGRDHTGPSRLNWEKICLYLRNNPDSIAAQALNNPLALSLARDAYANRDPAVLIDQGRFSSVEEVAQHLIAQFLITAYPDERRRKYAVTWLGWIAFNMGAHRDLGWWDIPNWVSPWKLRIARGLVAGSAVWLAYSSITFAFDSRPIHWVLEHGLIIGLIAAVVAGVIARIKAAPARTSAMHAPGWIRRLARAATFGVAFGVPFGLLFVGRDVGAGVRVGSGYATGLLMGLGFTLAAGLTLVLRLVWTRFRPEVAPAARTTVPSAWRGLTVSIWAGGLAGWVAWNGGKHGSTGLALVFILLIGLGLRLLFALVWVACPTGLSFGLAGAPQTLVPRWPRPREFGRLLIYFPMFISVLFNLWATPIADSPASTPASTYRADRRCCAIYGVMYGLLFAVIFGLLYWLAPQHRVTSGPLRGTVSGLAVGSAVWLMAWLVAGQVPRVRLTQMILLPERRGWARFLRLFEEGMDRQVLRQAGALYQFRHAALQGYLADMHSQLEPVGLALAESIGRPRSQVLLASLDPITSRGLRPLRRVGAFFEPLISAIKTFLLIGQLKTTVGKLIRPAYYLALIVGIFWMFFLEASCLLLSSKYGPAALISTAVAGTLLLAFSMSALPWGTRALVTRIDDRRAGRTTAQSGATSPTHSPLSATSGGRSFISITKTVFLVGQLKTIAGKLARPVYYIVLVIGISWAGLLNAAMFGPDSRIDHGDFIATAIAYNVLLVPPVSVLLPWMLHMVIIRFDRRRAAHATAHTGAASDPESPALSATPLQVHFFRGSGVTMKRPG